MTAAAVVAGALAASAIVPAQAKPSATALEVAAYRAIGARHPDPTIRNADHLAERLLGPAERAIQLAGGAEAVVKALDMDTDAAWASLGNRSVFARGVHVRTRHIDDVLADSLTAGIEQIVLLGAGLDSRAYRFDALRRMRVFELDLPQTQEYKKSRVREVLGSLPVGLVEGAGSAQVPAKNQNQSSSVASSKRMADGKEWMTANLNVNTPSSYCYDDAEANCGRYGRLYTWESAQRACQALGNRWRLPTDDEWRELAKHYGGLGNDSPAQGKAAYTALLSGGTSGFNAVLGGNRSNDGKYDRLEAHGFYWTVSENDSITAPFYNFGKGSQALYRQAQGQKQMAVSVRCVRE